MSGAAGIGAVEILRVLAALALVTGLTVGLGWLARRRTRHGSSSGLRVEERLTLTRSSQLVVVRVGERRLLVGASERGVQLVADLEDEALADGQPSDAGSVDDADQRAPLSPFARLLAGKLGTGGGAWR